MRGWMHYLPHQTKFEQPEYRYPPGEQTMPLAHGINVKLAMQQYKGPTAHKATKKLASTIGKKYSASTNSGHCSTDYAAITVYKCTHCSLTFSGKTGLQHHIYSQHKSSSSKQYGCDVCSRRFMLYQSMLRHRKSHDGIYRYQCKQCQKGFQNKSDYMGHMSKHTGIKRFKCNICLRDFAYKDHLTKHLKKTHPS